MYIFSNIVIDLSQKLFNQFAPERFPKRTVRLPTSIVSGRTIKSKSTKYSSKNTPIPWIPWIPWVLWIILAILFSCFVSTLGFLVLVSNLSKYNGSSKQLPCWLRRQALYLKWCCWIWWKCPGKTYRRLSGGKVGFGEGKGHKPLENFVRKRKGSNGKKRSTARKNKMAWIFSDIWLNYVWI